MGLLDLKTDLKSLKYGNDQRGGGSSNQPYIVTPIPDGYADTSPDFLLRNGRLNSLNSSQDVSRLTKFFLDTKSPNGLLFTAKQLLLERQNVEIPGGFNRIYNPASTLAQAGVLSSGYHLNKQGFNPFQRGYFNGGRDGYYQTTLRDNDLDINRLYGLYKIKQTNSTSNQPESLLLSSIYNISSNPSYLLSYSGGPGSILGVGKTNIRIQNPTRTVVPKEEATKAYKSLYINNEGYLIPSGPFTINWVYNPSYNLNINGQPGVSVKYTAELDLDEEEIYETFYTSNPSNILNRDIKSTGLTGVTSQQSILNNLNNVYVLTQQQIVNKSYSDPQGVHGPEGSNTLTDFRGELADKPIPNTDYVNFNRETTYGTSNTSYKITRDPTNPNESYNWDSLNSLEVIQGQKDELISETINKDIVKFFFEINNNNAQSDTQNWFLFFRAYLNNLTDNFQPDWQPYNYVGRAESFFRYSKFARTMQLSFTIYAHSREEMLPIYEKLNYLAGTTAPDYSINKPGEGLMKGNFINLTVGDYLESVPGIITSISLKPSFEAGWDLNRDRDGNIIKLGEYLVGQLPRMIDIDLGFTPIHSFVPQFKKKFIRNIPTPRELTLQAIRFQESNEDPTN